MKFKALVAPTIGELFDSTIQDMILSGELAIGEKLPTEQELAEMEEMKNRPTLEELLAALMEGIENA